MNFNDFDKQYHGISGPKKEEIREDINSILDKYSTYTHEELLNEFYRISHEEMERGNLDDDKLKSIERTLDPYLDAQSKARLNDILGRL